MNQEPTNKHSMAHKKWEREQTREGDTMTHEERRQYIEDHKEDDYGEDEIQPPEHTHGLTDVNDGEPEEMESQSKSDGKGEGIFNRIKKVFSSDR